MKIIASWFIFIEISNWQLVHIMAWRQATSHYLNYDDAYMRHSPAKNYIDASIYTKHTSIYHEICFVVGILWFCDGFMR